MHRKAGHVCEAEIKWLDMRFNIDESICHANWFAIYVCVQSLKLVITISNMLILSNTWTFS